MTGTDLKVIVNLRAQLGLQQVINKSALVLDFCPTYFVLIFTPQPNHFFIKLNLSIV